MAHSGTEDATTSGTMPNAVEAHSWLGSPHLQSPQMAPNSLRDILRA
ncbi:hypothetical protein DHODJN_22415 [Methylorubrum extorquens]